MEHTMQNNQLKYKEKDVPGSAAKLDRINNTLSQVNDVHKPPKPTSSQVLEYGAQPNHQSTHLNLTSHKGQRVNQAPMKQ